MRSDLHTTHIYQKSIDIVGDIFIRVGKVKSQLYYYVLVLLHYLKLMGLKGVKYVYEYENLAPLACDGFTFWKSIYLKSTQKLLIQISNPVNLTRENIFYRMLLPWRHHHRHLSSLLADADPRPPSEKAYKPDHMVPCDRLHGHHRCSHHRRNNSFYFLRSDSTKGTLY